FGLDPDRIAVGGTSAGAVLAGIVATSPAMGDKVRRVVGQSGLGVSPISASEASSATGLFLDTLEHLRPGRTAIEHSTCDDLLLAQERVASQVGPSFTAFAF